MGIFLTVLAKIGLVLLWIIGIVLILVLLVLFVPIRYKGKAVFPGRSEKITEKAGDDPESDDSESDGFLSGYSIIIRLSWLLGFLSFTLKMTDGEDKKTVIRLCGIPLIVPGFVKKLSGKLMKKGEKDEPEEVNWSEEENESKEVNDLKEVNETEEDNEIEVENENTETRASGDSDTVNGEGKEVSGTESRTGKQKKAKKGKKERTKKITGKLNKIKSIFNKIKDVKNNPSFSDGIKIIKSTLIKILRHIKPKKIHADLTVGTGDPCNTGRMLGGISIIMALWPGDYRIMPDFEDRVIEGNVFLKGRVRVISLLCYIIMFVNDENIKKLWRTASKKNRS